MLQGLWSHLAKQHPLVCKNQQDLGKPQDLAISPDPPPDLPISLGVVGIEDLAADLGKLPDHGGGINVPDLTTWSARCAQYLPIGGWFLASR